VGDQAAGWLTEAVGDLERVEDGLGTHVAGELPADDHAAVAVEDEGEIAEAVPGPDVGQIGDPLLVRAGRSEITLEQIAGPFDRGLVRDRRPLLAAAELADERVLAHHPGDLVAPGLDLAPLQLLPRLAGAVDATAAGPGRLDRREQLAVGEFARRRYPRA
jgi:hypothetical protein